MNSVVVMILHARLLNKYFIPLLILLHVSKWIYGYLLFDFDVFNNANLDLDIPGIVTLHLTITN